MGRDFGASDVAGRVDELAEVSVGHRRAVDPETVDSDTMDRRFFGKFLSLGMVLTLQHSARHGVCRTQVDLLQTLGQQVRSVRPFAGENAASAQVPCDMLHPGGIRNIQVRPDFCVCSSRFATNDQGGQSDRPSVGVGCMQHFSLHTVRAAYVLLAA